MRNYRLGILAAGVGRNDFSCAGLPGKPDYILTPGVITTIDARRSPMNFEIGRQARILVKRTRPQHFAPPVPFAAARSLDLVRNAHRMPDVTVPAVVPELYRELRAIAGSGSATSSSTVTCFPTPGSCRWGASSAMRSGRASKRVTWKACANTTWLDLLARCSSACAVARSTRLGAFAKTPGNQFEHGRDPASIHGFP